MRRARRALAVAFFVNGAGLSSWAPRVPQIKDGLGLDAGTLGLALAGLSAGAIAATIAAGWLVGRYGSSRTTIATGVLLCAALALPGLAPSALLLALALAAAGAGDAANDVAMNAHGVVIEDRYSRPILSSLHAWWSVGTAAGGLTGAAAAALGVPVALHLGATGAVLSLLLATAARRLLPATADRATITTATAVRPRMLAVARAALLLSVVALLAAVIEAVPFDWSAVYAREHLGAGPGVAGATYAAFAVAMVLARTVGDRLTMFVGAPRLVRRGALLAAAGMAVALVGGHPAAGVAGFAALGFGVAAMFPALFAASGRLPGVPAGAGIAAVSLLARAGFLAAPLLIGALAEATDLRAAPALAIVAALAVAGLSGPVLCRR